MDLRPDAIRRGRSGHDPMYGPGFAIEVVVRPVHRRGSMTSHVRHEIWLFRHGVTAWSVSGQLAGRTLDLGGDIAATVESSVG